VSTDNPPLHPKVEHAAERVAEVDEVVEAAAAGTGVVTELERLKDAAHLRHGPNHRALHGAGGHGGKQRKEEDVSEKG